MSPAAAAERSPHGSAWRWRSRAILFVLIGVAIVVSVIDYALISAALSRAQLCYNARQETAQVIETLVRQESSLRAFTSTRDREYLKPYHEANKEAEVRLVALRRDVIQVKVPDALPYLTDVERIHEEWAVYVAAPLIDDPTGPLAASRQETGELLFTTLANDIGKLSAMLEREALAQQSDANIKVTIAIAEVAVLTICFAMIVIRLQRTTRKIENRYFADISEANENLNRAQHLAGVGNWTMDLMTRKVTWSEELRRIYGVSVREVDDELLRTFDHPEDAPTVQRTIESAISEQRSYNIEHRIVRRDGFVRYVQEQGEFMMSAGTTPLKMIGTIVDVTDRKQAEEILAHLAQHDALTGLPNRALLHERLSQSIEFAKRHNRIVAVLYMDVDRFKIVNDSLGHAAGDTLLVDVSRRLSHAVRGGDTVARLGGDEFVVVLADMQHERDVRAVAEKIRTRCCEPFIINERELFVSTSIGVCTYPNDASDVEELMECSDAAMYQAKERGRNNVQYYTADMHLLNARKLSIEQDIRKGLEREEFVLHYQPIVSVNSGIITGFESLVRWNHPTRGLVPPAEFIPAAEESGLIVPLGEWVLRKAVEQHREWRRKGLSSGRVTVNISPRQFQQRELTNLIGDCVRTYGCRPGDLELELTESLVMREVDASLRTLHELKAMGVSISLDDFGTGYSSLNYLKRFPIDSLKIDRSFIRDINVDTFDKAISEAIVTLAGSLKVRVIGEGVETKEQLDTLRRIGCDEAQGFLFSKPIPAEQATALLAASLSLYG